MPIALEPDSKYDYVLSSDASKPKDKQPTFVFKYLSARKWKELAACSDSFEKDDSGEKAMDAVFEAIKKSLIGWRNMIGPDGKEIGFDIDKLEDIVTPAEAMELMQAAVTQTPSIEDKKKSDSQSPSSTASSAKAVKGKPNAQTSQPTPAP